MQSYYGKLKKIKNDMDHLDERLGKLKVISCTNLYYIQSITKKTTASKNLEFSFKFIEKVFKVEGKKTKKRPG